FLFQAQDGIRDLYVTGVQTCALPISGSCLPWSCASAAWWTRSRAAWVCASSSASRWAIAWCSDSGLPNVCRCSARSVARSSAARSEERRVGKKLRDGVWQDEEEDEHD